MRAAEARTAAKQSGVHLHEVTRSLRLRMATAIGSCRGQGPGMFCCFWPRALTCFERGCTRRRVRSTRSLPKTACQRALRSLLSQAGQTSSVKSKKLEEALRKAGCKSAVSALIQTHCIKMRNKRWLSANSVAWQHSTERMRRIRGSYQVGPGPADRCPARACSGAFCVSLPDNSVIPVSRSGPLFALCQLLQDCMGLAAQPCILQGRGHR